MKTRSAGSPCHEAPDGFKVRCVAAQDPMLAKDPEIAAYGHRTLRCFRYRVLIRQAGAQFVLSRRASPAVPHR